MKNLQASMWSRKGKNMNNVFDVMEQNERRLDLAVRWGAIVKAADMFDDAMSPENLLLLGGEIMRHPLVKVLRINGAGTSVAALEIMGPEKRAQVKADLLQKYDVRP